MGREDKIREEAVALWQHLYADPPPADVDSAALLGMIMCRLPDTSYGRLINPHLRPTNIVFPKPEES